MAKTLLLEIGTEELPASFVLPALEQMKELATKSLFEARIDFASLETYGTPRRLVLIGRNVAEHQREATFEVRGPRRDIAFDGEGNPTKAAEGFARAQGVSVKSLIVKVGEGGEFVFAVKHEPGKPTVEVLGELLPKLISQLSFPKQMRWGSLNFKFGRPIRWLVAMLGKEVIPFELAGLRSDRFSYGHRFLVMRADRSRYKLKRAGRLRYKDALRARPIRLPCADGYPRRLEVGYVIVNHTLRRELIRQLVEAEANRMGGKAIIPDSLLNEVNFLVEYPLALHGRFDESYLALPGDVLITVMMHHQRYFPVTDEVGSLMPFFIAICNGGEGSLDLIRQGNEKVLQARLSDAKFFFEEDIRHPLESRVEELKGLLFQQGFGSMLEKTERIKSITERLCERLCISGSQREQILRAAWLCKADLTTSMVVEFTELQGVMGREYALRSGEPKEVAQAIFEHYLPRWSGDEMPTSFAGALIGLSDRADTLCACFDRQMIPSGSSDPLGLRRAGQSILSLLHHLELHLSLEDLVEDALETLSQAGLLKSEPAATKAKVMDFLRQRMDSLLEELGIAHDIREAVIAVGFDDVAGTVLRARVLTELREKFDNFVPVVTTFTRITNILTQRTDAQLNPDLFEHPLEKRLYDEFCQVTSQLPFPLRGKDGATYREAFEKLATLKPAIDDFFGVGPTGVLVMHPDERLRNNRLALVQEVESALRQIADFSKLILRSPC